MKNLNIDPELRSRYQTIIGSLLYLTLGIQPDIAFAVTKLAQYAARPNKEHLNKALYIYCYLVGMQNYRLTYNGNHGEGLSTITEIVKIQLGDKECMAEF